MTPRPCRTGLSFLPVALCVPLALMVAGCNGSQAAFDGRLPYLLQVPAAVRWVSLEPLLGPIMVPGVIEAGADGRDGIWCDPLRRNNRNAINWVVVGCESGQQRRFCDNAWVKGIVDQCLAAGVPCFVKQIQVGPKREVVHDAQEIADVLGYRPEQIRQVPERDA